MSTILRTHIIAIAAVFSCAAVSTAVGIAGGVIISVPSEVTVVNDTLVVESVTTPVAGFIVVHAMTMGAPAEVIGYAAINKGTNPSVEIRLVTKPKIDDMLFLMLHADTGTSGAFEFVTEGPDADAPLMALGRPVMEIVTVINLH
jgi:hypothetical protein